MTTHGARSYDAIIIGAGAAGMMCAIAAGQLGRKVLLLDHGESAGAKILISGGGRCNFTNLDAAPEHFISNNPHFCKSALSRYTQHDFIAMVERHHIAYHEKALGQLFCDGSARQIVAMLLEECDAAGVEIVLRCSVTGIARRDNFELESAAGVFAAPAVVIATGGLSIPKLGASGFAYSIARQFNLAIVAPRPGLVPMRVEGDALRMCRALSGVSHDARVSCGNAAFRGNILFTHRGLSGPAILQISSYWKPGDSLDIDLLPDGDAPQFLLDRKRTRPKAELKTVLAEVLPTRLADILAQEVPARGAIANLPDRSLHDLAARLKRWRLAPSESEGWEKAEVTVGGIDTAELSSKTMEARAVHGLYFIGEAVDVTGWLGGYNFQWAWSSGWCAGQAL
jgi:predicted Rossmann fold flavoprotein